MNDNIGTRIINVSVVYNKSVYYVPTAMEFCVVSTVVTSPLSATRTETVCTLIKRGLWSRSVDDVVWDHPPAKKQCMAIRWTTGVKHLRQPIEQNRSPTRDKITNSPRCERRAVNQFCPTDISVNFFSDFECSGLFRRGFLQAVYSAGTVGGLWKRFQRRRRQQNWRRRVGRSVIVLFASVTRSQSSAHDVRSAWIRYSY